LTEINGDIFHDNRKPAALKYHKGTTMTTTVSASASQLQSQSRVGSRSIKLDESSAIVEHILSAIERRGENGLNHYGGPLTNTEIVKLSMLCTQQTEWNNRSINNNNNNSNSDSILSEDIGFADVDADMMAQLVEHLEKHVALASQIDLVQSSYDTIQKLKKGNKRLAGCSNIDEVSGEE
jgi:hypothetical protein